MGDKRDKKAANLRLIKLPALENFFGANGDRVLKAWRYGVIAAEKILALPFDVFWIKLIDEPQIVLFLDSFLEEFPRFWDVDQTKSYVNGDPDIRVVVNEMYLKVFLLLYRASTFKENNKEISEDLFKRSIYDNRIFTVERLINIISVYWKNNEDAVRGILQRTVGTQTKFLKDIISSVNVLATVFPTTITSLKELLLSLNVSDKNYEEVNSLLSFCNDILHSVPLLVTCCPHDASLQDACIVFCNSIPNFVEFLEDVVLPKVDDYYSSTACGSANSDSTSLIDFVRYLAFRAFNTLLHFQNDEGRLLGVLQDGLVYEKFLFYYNLEYPIENTLSPAATSNAIFSYIKEALNKNSSKQESNILNRLREQGMLVNLGVPSDPVVAKQIDNLIELLPHFSRQFVHLCLRNFGYDIEKCTNALLDFTSLPLDLRALATVEWTIKDVKNVGAGVSPNSVINNPNDSAEKVKFETTQETSKGLFSMKPVVKDVTSIGKDLNLKGNEPEKTTSDQRLRNMLAQMKLQNKEKFQETDGTKQEKNELLVKLGSGIEKYYVPDSDKVALRPSYEKYLYEEGASLPWDAYEDEYDDTMDDPQAYNVDADVEVLPDVLSGVEPNTNRQLVEESESDENENEVLEEDQSYFGRGRRAREKCAKVEMKKLAADEAGLSNVCDGNLVEKSDSGEERQTGEDVGVRGARRGRGRSFRNSGGARGAAYTGGRDRQMKERRKGNEKRRGADRKRRGAFF